MKRILKILAVFAVFLFVLWLGGYSLNSFNHSLEIQMPSKVFQPLIEAVPTFNQDSPSPIDFGGPDPTDTAMTIATGSDSGIDGSNVNETLPTIKSTLPEGGGATEQIGLTLSRDITVNVNGQSINLKTTTSLSFIKWLANNYKDGDTLEFFDKDGNPIEETTTETTTETVAESSSEVTTTETSEITTETTEIPSVNPKLIDEVEVKYDDQLQDYAHFVALVKTIEIVDELPDYSSLPKYNRDDFEKPIKTYILGGIKCNRNDYAWMSSSWYNSKDITYTCPYTGQIIENTDGPNKIDFDPLDYDHIVPLKSAYIRGASNWNNSKRNEYAYDQWVGVDVLASANRSKADKGPLEYLPEKNVEDYCYSWILICSKYGLKMTQAEIDLCDQYVKAALANGEPVTHLGGHYE